jgi:hypothetical protein
MAPESGVLGMTTVNSSPPYRAQAFVALLMAVGVIVELEKIDVHHQQRQGRAVARRALGLFGELDVERSPVRQSGEAVAGRQRLQIGLRLFLRGDVAQRLHHRDQLARIVVDRPGVDRQIQPMAEPRHQAPVFRGNAEIAQSETAVALIKRADFVETARQQQIGQARPALGVKGSPVLGRADDLLGGHPGQPFAGFVPNQHTAIGPDDESRNNEMLHQTHGKAVVPLRNHRPNRELLRQRGHRGDVSAKTG